MPGVGGPGGGAPSSGGTTIGRACSIGALLAGWPGHPARRSARRQDRGPVLVRNATPLARPLSGFIHRPCKWVGYWRSGETEDEVWRRAVCDVHDYWRPTLTDDRH